MEFRLTQQAAVQMLDAWERHLATNPGLRALEDGTILLDSAAVVPVNPAVPRTPFVPAMDGSVIIAWYRASEEPTAQAIAEARMATQVLGLPRELYVGKLISIQRGKDRTVYLKCRTITRQNASGEPAYRTLNPSKGQLVELLINPTQADIASAMARNQNQEG
jgi:hypothetical protein